MASLCTAATQDQQKAKIIVETGKHFLKCFAKLAELSLAASKPLFAFRPKLHYFHHLVIEMQSVLNAGGLPLNPLAHSCAMAEDFIGRASLLSRRTHAITCEKRVIQRYLAGAMAIWKKDDGY